MRRIRNLWRVWLVGDSRRLFEKRLFVGEEGEARAFLAGRRSAGILNDCSLYAGEPSAAEEEAMRRLRAQPKTSPKS